MNNLLLVGLAKAAFHDRYGLPYAPAAVDDLLARTGPAPMVVNIGVGTRQQARQFALRSGRVYVIELDPAGQR